MPPIPSPSSRAAPPARKRAADGLGRLPFGASVAVVLVLHAAAIAVVVAAPGSSSATVTASRAPSITVVAVAVPAPASGLAGLGLAHPAPPAPRVLATTARANASAPVGHSMPVSIPPTTEAAEPASTLLWPVSTTAAATEPTGHFYSSAEVERPAEPNSDWNLDPAALDLNGITSLVFDIFIGRDGEVIACTILDPAELAPETRLALEQRLRQSVAQPALRGGLPVPSVRRIEVSVATVGG